MSRLAAFFRQLPISQQLALLAASSTLIATLALVWVAARSSIYLQHELQREFGLSTAQQLADNLADELAAGDRLGMVAQLSLTAQRTTISGARILDVDGQEIGRVGDLPESSATLTAPIRIDENLAGTVVIALNGQILNAERHSLFFGLGALAVLLSIAVYGVTRPLGSRVGRNLNAVSAELGFDEEDSTSSGNELQKLQSRIAALPLDLLRPRGTKDASEEQYADTAILYVALLSLPDYIDTLDERRLQRYVSALHHLIFGAAGFYGGQLQVVRPFGVAVVFSGEHNIGSPALRAASCGWLCLQACADAEDTLRLSVKLGLAVDTNELGLGDEHDLYPGLYTQSALDDLHRLAREGRDGVLIRRGAAQDFDLKSRADVDPIDAETFALGSLGERHRDLLERQLQLLRNALFSAQKSETP